MNTSDPKNVRVRQESSHPGSGQPSRGNPHDTAGGLMVMTEAICLKTWAFGEADRIVAFHSADKGNIRAIAKGVKRAKSKLAAACQPLNCCDIQLLPGRSLDKLIQVQPTESFSHLREDLLAMALGLICAELSLNLSSEETANDAPLLYHLLKNSLMGLNQAAQNSENILPLMSIATGFIVEWLNLAGYPPHWEACMHCERSMTASGRFEYFSADLGGLVCSACRNNPENRLTMIAANPVAVSQSTLTVVQTPQKLAFWQEATPAKVLAFCEYYLTHKLGHGVKSFGFALGLLVTACP